MGDLQGLVLPLISVDEYKAKMGSDDEIMVMAFFLDDEAPGKDLVKFIKKGPIDVLDVELSNIPNEEGYWLVWVEIPRKEALKKIFRILYMIKGLTGLEKWQFKPYGIDKIYELTAKKLRACLEQNS